MADEFKFDEAFERARPYLRLLAQTNLGERLKQKIDASDVIQQTYLHAHKNREQFQGSSEPQLVAWLKAILKNRLIDMARHWKGQKRNMDRDVNLQQKVDDSFQRVDDWLAMSQTSPSMAVERDESLLILSAAVEKLPDQLREVVVMHHLQGMKLVEISKAVSCDETTVGRRLFRGMKQLGELMGA